MKKFMLLIAAMFAVMLCVSCEDNGGKSTPGAGTVVYAIGDTGPGGGIVFYVTGGGEHGLEAAAANAGAGIRWNNGHDTVTAASAVVTGYGQVNTDTIIAAQGADQTSYAAGLARSYHGGGYSDWHLPSRDELNLMYVNLKCAVPELGNFGNYYYWSSSEYDAVMAWCQAFDTGLINGTDKESPIYVRPVREF